MVSKIIDFIKTHKLVLVLVVVVLLLLGRQKNLNSGLSLKGVSSIESDQTLSMPNAVSSKALPVAGGGIGGGMTEITVEDRMVIEETNLSLLVKSVEEVTEKIQTLAEGAGGFLVSSNLSKPEGAASGSITIRVLSDKKDEVLTQIRSLGVKTVSENVRGVDVTDKYTDIEARLDVLNKTKIKFEEIMNGAVSVADLLDVQRELISLQAQIDNLKGQKEYLEKSASLTKITVYLSTDELALPFAPDKAWRPEVVLKNAVRSFIGTVRGLAGLAIWVVVYAPVWGIVILVYWLWRRRQSRV